MDLKIKTLFEWIRKNEGFIHPNIEYDENFKLIISKKLGAKGVSLYSLPKKLCIDSGTYKKYHPSPGIFSQMNEKDMECFNQPFFKLILNLISEKLKGKNSFYRPFISSFPPMEELVKKSPLFYYNDQKENWNKVLPTLVKKLDNLNNFYINLYLIIIKLKVFKINLRLFPGYSSEEDVLKTLILWAFLIVNNYAIENEYLLPLFNLMHYSHETENMVTIDNNRINFSFGDIEKNNLVIHNGLLDNETLFALHGYMNDDTEKKFLEIKLSEKYTIENEDVKLVVANTFNRLFNRSIQKYYITKDTPSISLVQYLRILSLTKKDLDLIKKEDTFFMKFISMDNEANVHKKLLKIVKIKYNYIKKCIDKDNETDTDDVKVLKQILKEQKSILQNMYYEIHKKWINILESEYDEELLINVFKIE